MSWYVPAAPAMGTSTTLYTLSGANLTTTVDQVLQKAFAFTKYVIDRIVFANASAPVVVAKGGFYTGVSKTGTSITAPTQPFSGLDSTAAVLNPIPMVGGQTVLTADPILSLTTAEGTPVTADVYIMGVAG